MKKEKIDYFAHFITVTELAEKQAELLGRITDEYDPSKLNDYIKEMHSFEHKADQLKNQMITELVKDFLPPIEREDIMLLADLYDSVCDSLDDVMLRFYMYNIKELRQDVRTIVSKIQQICLELGNLTKELKGFKAIDRLMNMVTLVNDIEDEGDRLYIEATHSLYAEHSDSTKTGAWANIYSCLEECFDSCEKVADEVKTVIIKNC